MVKTKQVAPAVDTKLLFGTETSDELATAITQVAEAGARLLQTRLTLRTLVVLLHDSTGLPMRDIRTLLLAIPDLRKYVKAGS